MPKYHALEMIFQPHQDSLQFEVIARQLEQGMNRYGGYIVHRSTGAGCHHFVLGFPERRMGRMFFAGQNWLDLSIDLEAAGIRSVWADWAWAEAA